MINSIPHSLTIDNKDVLKALAKHDSTIAELKRHVSKNTQQAVYFNTTTRDTLKIHVPYIITQKADTIHRHDTIYIYNYPAYPFSWKDKWLNVNGLAGADTVRLFYSIMNEYVVNTVKNKRDSLTIQITSLNPHTHVNKELLYTLPIKRKKMGWLIGIGAGIGLGVGYLVFKR